MIKTTAQTCEARLLRSSRAVFESIRPELIESWGAVACGIAISAAILLARAGGVL